MKKTIPEEPAVSDDVFVDLKAAATLKPEARPKWLVKAKAMVADGRASSTDLYNIVVSRKFASGLPDRIRRKLAATIRESLDLFSDKQKRFLNSSDCPLMAQNPARDVGIDDEVEGMRPEELKSKEAAVAAAASRAEQAVQDAGRVAALNVGAHEETPGGWQAAQDDAALKRLRRQTVEAERDAARRDEKRRQFAAEEEAVERQAAAEEAARKQKLEEEADNLFMRAMAPKPQVSVPSSGNGRRSSSLSVPRAASRSRSISSRAARKALKDKERKRRPSADLSSSALTGSRAIFLNKDFVEDLPHMPRPSAPGAQGLGPRRMLPSRSRSRDRRRRGR